MWQGSPSKAIFFEELCQWCNNETKVSHKFAVATHLAEEPTLGFWSIWKGLRIDALNFALVYSYLLSSNEMPQILHARLGSDEMP